MLSAMHDLPWLRAVEQLSPARRRLPALAAGHGRGPGPAVPDIEEPLGPVLPSPPFAPRQLGFAGHRLPERARLRRLIGPFVGADHHPRRGLPRLRQRPGAGLRASTVQFDGAQSLNLLCD